MKKIKYFSSLSNLLIVIKIISFSSNQTSNIFPVYKVILSQNINNLDNSINMNYNFKINTKGIGIVFDYNSDISFIPFPLFREIYRFYLDMYYKYLYFDTKTKEDYFMLRLSGKREILDPIHFILKDRGIRIPINFLFKKGDDIDDYTYIPMVKEGEENIIIGKDLISVMDIEFKDNDLIIHNEDFVIKLNE